MELLLTSRSGIKLVQDRYPEISVVIGKHVGAVLCGKPLGFGVILYSSCRNVCQSGSGTEPQTSIDHPETTDIAATEPIGFRIYPDVAACDSREAADHECSPGTAVRSLSYGAYRLLLDLLDG
jgi:hypothetical protein